jgi:hypothetical protein
MKTSRKGDLYIDAVAVGCTSDVSEEPCFQKDIYFEDNTYITSQKSNKIVLTNNLNNYV